MSRLNHHNGLDEEVLDLILVHQKDKLLEKLNLIAYSQENRARHVAEFRYALTILADLWAAAGYSYKMKEISERLKEMRKQGIDV